MSSNDTNDWWHGKLIVNVNRAWAILLNNLELGRMSSGHTLSHVLGKKKRKKSSIDIKKRVITAGITLTWHNVGAMAHHVCTLNWLINNKG